MRRVLVVDDEPNIRWTMSEFLRREGYEAAAAADYDDALNVHDSGAFSAAVVDIILPHRGGVELLEELQRRDPALPVIMMTGEPNIARLPEIVRAGAYDFLTKPVTKEMLLKAVARAVEKKALDETRRELEDALSRHALELEERIAERTAELASARNFLNAAFDSATDYAIVTLDEQSRVTLFNRGAEIIFGYEAVQVTGLSFRRLLAEDEHFPQGNALPSREERAAPDTVSGYKVRARRASGECFTASLAITPIRASAGQHAAGQLAIIKDLSSEEKRAAELAAMQARLSHNEKIAALGQMAAQVAHEVRNPLAGMRLYVLHLRERVADQLSPDDLTLIDKIISGVDRLAGTADQILNFARPHRLSPCPVNVVRVMRDLLELLEPHAAAARVRVTLVCAAPKIVAVLDEVLFHAALFNLALNSIQAMSGDEAAGGGELSISVGEARGGLHIVIADTGRGMTAEQIGRAFDLFYTTSGTGLGLGMPFAKKVIEQHRGSIAVESAPGKGTRVEIELPNEGVMSGGG